MSENLQFKINQESGEIMIIYPNGEIEWSGAFKALVIAAKWMWNGGKKGRNVDVIEE